MGNTACAEPLESWSGSTRVGRPSIKLRKMHSRNIIFTAFDNLMFMPIYLFEQSRNQPKRAATTVLVLLVLAIVGSSAEKLDTTPSTAHN